ncbi:MAG: FAD-dependent thymidylate synthase, partial [Clostridia bacterium]|nr:FAD-dependent thymidylate synthase [Clostridia bacterium]
FEYITPPEIEAIPEAKAEFVKAMEEDAEHYEKLRELLTEKHKAEFMASGMDEKTATKAAEKMANEDARFVLPNACDTKIIMTMNVRSLFHFFELRCCNRAQWEIRELATEMLRLVKGVAPNLFSHAGPSCVYGACSEGAYSCGKAAEVREKFRNLGEKTK